MKNKNLNRKQKNRIKEEKKYYEKNKKELLENKDTVFVDDIGILTWDYNFQKLLSNTQIKDFLIENCNKNSQENKHFEEWKKNLEKKLYRDLKYKDFLYGDWWRIYNKKTDEFKYVTISTPYLRNENQNIDFEINSLISKHYHLNFGYEYPFYISHRFVPYKKYKNSKKTKLYTLELPDKRIIDTDTLINNWIKENKDTDTYNFYKNIILKTNEESINLEKPFIKDYSSIYNPDDIYSFNVVVPFLYEEYYPNLFKNLFENNIDKKNENESNIYDEDNVEKFLIKNQEWSEFLIQFKPIIPEKRQFIIKKRKFKQK